MCRLLTLPLCLIKRGDTLGRQHIWMISFSPVCPLSGLPNECLCFASQVMFLHIFMATDANRHGAVIFTHARETQEASQFFSEALTRIQEWLTKSCLLLNSKKQCLYSPNDQLRWCTLICSCKVKCTRLQMSLSILNSLVSCRTLEFTKQRTQGCSGLRGQAESLNSHEETRTNTEGWLEHSNVSLTMMEKMSCLLMNPC